MLCGTSLTCELLLLEELDEAVLEPDCAQAQLAALLAALAAAWALGISPELMGAGLQTFAREAPIALAPVRRAMDSARNVTQTPETLALKSA